MTVFVVTGEVLGARPHSNVLSGNQTRQWKIIIVDCASYKPPFLVDFTAIDEPGGYQNLNREHVRNCPPI